MKKCTKCFIEKDESEFYPRYGYCKICSNKKVREYYKKNFEKIKKYVKEWQHRNKEKMSGYRKKVKDKHNEYNKIWRDEKKKNGYYGNCKKCGDALGRNEGKRGKNRNGYCINCNRGSVHQNYRGGSINNNGYIFIGGKNGGLLHRKIVEDFIGRKLKTEECVHHINENKLDNRLENLSILSVIEHQRLHQGTLNKKIISVKDL